MSNDARVRDVLRVLCRIAIPRWQLALYRLLVNAPTAGITSEQVRAALHINPAQHRGLMAALTLRTNNTPREVAPEEKPGLGLLMRQQWNGSQNTYWPTPELIAAIGRLPTLAESLKRPVDEIATGSSVSFDLPGGVVAEPVAPYLAPLPVIVPDTPFAELIADLDAGGLVFPSELIANLLLALQVKRFVILTGISGTGKTKIGQTLARRFQATRQEEVVSELDERSVVVQVQPYMLTRRRVVIPVSLSTQLGRDEHGPGRIQGRWPGGTIELATYRQGSAFIVLFKGALKDWIHDTFALGSHLVIRLEGPDDELPDTVVFEAPTDTEHLEVKVENSVIVAVRPDWTDHRGLLGHYNPLSQRYVVTPFLSLLLRATDEAAIAVEQGRAASPFFALLDEMNLARVEHYFSDFLSCLESGDALHLHDETLVEEGGTEDDGPPVPRRLAIPSNLFIIGTVNVDESTYLFSPKVLDRAFAIELNTVDLVGLADGMARGSDLDLVKWSGALVAPLPPSREDWTWFSKHQHGELVTHVLALHALLARYHRHFGYRVAEELARFVRLAVEQTANPGESADEALDLAILQKILVKLNGTQSELQELVAAMLELMLAGAGGTPEMRNLTKWRLDPITSTIIAKDEASEVQPLFPRSAAKLWRMQDRLRRQGFASWIE